MIASGAQGAAPGDGTTRHGLGAALCVALQSLAVPLGLLYGGVMAVRRRLYASGALASHVLPVPVVSVGNLSMGGTGKTPLVSWLVARALAAGKRVGVLSRGYGRAPGAALNDEGEMLAARFPGLPQVQDVDRVRGGRRLVAEHAVDWIVLDDGFQHRRLRRDRDLVCLDARKPLSDLRVVPAGSQREFPSALRAAHAIVLTRVDQAPAGTLEAWGSALARRGVAAPVFAARHAPTRLRLRPEGREMPCAALQGRDVVLLSGIARPESFAATARALGARVVAEHRYRDHHRFQAREIERAATRARSADAWLLVTEKDEARLRGCTQARCVLEVDLHFVGAEPGPEALCLA
ncbi:MAG: tetraacyldisaccharide 4'-kinase [Planctomycetes bacterium]|nr:tetraacyldisaccharide 4'-kinase [Planctomycetota bacterium]